MTQTVFATSLFDGSSLVADAVLRHRHGVIEAVLPGQDTPAGPRRLVVPALVNAHDHARPSMTSFGAANMPLETWILRSALGTPPDPYLAAAVALGALVGPAQVGPLEARVEQPRVPQPAALEHGVAQVGARQVGLGQVDLTQRLAVQRHPAQVGRHEVAIDEARVAHARLGAAPRVVE